MNKKALRTAGWALGLALVVGGISTAASIANFPSVPAQMVAAAETADPSVTDGYYDTFGAGAFDTDHITWTMAEGNITMTQYKGTGGTNVNSSYNTAGRVYKGHYLAFEALNDYKIYKVEITVDGTYYGNSMTAGTSVSENVVQDSTTTVKRTWATTSGGTHSVSSASSSGLSNIYIQNVATSNVQLRWKNGGVKVYYTKPAASGAITGVTIDDIEEHELEISSGYLGRKKVALAATVSQSGTGLSEKVTWSSSDESVMTVDEDGIVTILANDTARITATSQADTNFSDYVDITASGLETFAGTETETEFTTSVYGSSNIVSTVSGEPVDLSGSLTTATISVDKHDATGTINPGFIAASSPISARLYGGTQMTIAVPREYKLYWIDLTSIEGNEMTSANTNVNSGVLEYKGINAVVDCTESSVYSVTFTFSAQVRLSAISVSFAEKEVTSVTIEGASTDIEFLKGSTVTTEMIKNAGITASATFEDASNLDVTDDAQWELDTSAEGTAKLYATYGNVKSDGVDVTISGSAVPATAVTISPEESQIYVGETVQLSASVAPDNATDKSVVWTSSDPDIATVDESGLVTGHAAGEAYITATANGGTDVEDVALVTVKNYEYSKAGSINGGDKVVFGNAAETKYLSDFSTTSTIYGIATAYEGFIPATNAFTVVAGALDGTVAFKNSQGLYLSWTTGNSLKLFEIDGTTNKALTANESWTVSFDGFVAEIQNAADSSENGRRILWNESSDRFATYSNTWDNNVTLWKLDGSEGESAALGFASSTDGFMKDIGADVCDLDGKTNTGELVAAWDLYAEAYESLSDEAKAYIASCTKNASGNDVEKMLSLYEYIYNRYGESLKLSNWLARTEVSKALVNTGFAPIANKKTPILIVTILGMSAAATGLFVLVSRKHKRKED